MHPVLRTALGRLNLTLLSLAIFCATFWFTDRTTNHHPPAPRIDPAEVAALRAARAHRPRVFVLILDSLRYATATDPAIMPHLGALRHEGVYARVDPGFNSSSAAALRDAFTGRENASALAVVSTFLKTDAGVESIFHQLALAGLTSAAYGQDFFTQFGAGVRHQTVINYRSPRELEEANILAAVEALRRGDDDFVIGHLTYTDYAAHDFGIYDPAYREAFVRADAFIPRVRAALPPDTTFIVMGDHGHDEQGKHGFGMDVPTFTVYVGTPFRRDRDIGPINLPTHRFLMSYAAGIPLNVAGYTGRFPVEALDGRHDEVGPLMAQAEAARSGAGQRAWLVWLQISLLGALCFNLYCRGHSPLDFRGGRALLPWLGLAPLAIAHDWQPALGLTVLGLITAWLARGVPVRQLLRWVAVPTLAGLAFNGWGRAVLALRPTLQALPTAALVIAGLGVALAGALASTRARRPWVTGVVFAVLLLLLPPTSERYGFPAMLVPLLGCWFLFHAVSLWREASPAMRPAGGLLLTGAGLVLLTQPFVSTLALNGSFVGWQPLVPGLDWQNLPLMAGLAFLAKLVIFFPRRPGWGAALLGLGLTVLLLLSETQLGRPNSYWQIGLMAACLLGWGMIRRARPDEARLLLLTFWFLLFYYSIALTPRSFLETGCLLGALTLAARSAARHSQPENIRADYLALAVLGLLLSGWACMRWSATNLEWHTAYDWFSAPTVEHHAGLFVPWIALKCLIPWVLVLLCLRQEFGPGPALPANTLLVLFSVKVLGMLMLNTGLGGADTLNRSYLEAAGVSGVLAILFLGVILLPRAWPRPVISAGN